MKEVSTVLEPKRFRKSDEPTSTITKASLDSARSIDVDNSASGPSFTIAHFTSVDFKMMVIQMCECENRYCKEAVNSVEIVTACPTSKTEWEIAARKKNCERIASRQKLLEAIVNGEISIITGPLAVFDDYLAINQVTVTYSLPPVIKKQSIHLESHCEPTLITAFAEGESLILRQAQHKYKSRSRTQVSHTIRDCLNTIDYTISNRISSGI
uniref:Uncharacterized protein n=1 Tax=Magallana gigas TaxID=29159 RepID=K1QRC5_MAGGI